MIDLNAFKELFPTTKVENFSSDELDALKKALPNELYELLHQEQISTYGTNFFKIINPLTSKNVLENWGISVEDSFPFLVSAFGTIVYIKKDTCFALNPHAGNYTVLGDTDPTFIFNFILTYDYTLKTSFYYNVFMAHQGKLPTRKPNEIYCFSPPLSAVKEIEDAKIIKDDFLTQFIKLADNFSNEAEED